MWQFIWHLPDKHPIVFLVVIFVLVMVAIAQDGGPDDDFPGGP